MDEDARHAPYSCILQPPNCATRHAVKDYSEHKGEWRNSSSLVLKGLPLNSLSYPPITLGTELGRCGSHMCLHY